MTMVKSINEMKSEKRTDKYGDTYWYKPGTNILHREDGPAVELSNGTKYWYKDGKHHREDGPAVEHSSGTKWWYKNGKRHREDGPAIELDNGEKEYWLNYQRIMTENDEEFQRILKLKGFI